MTALAPTLEAFFTQHLAGQRQASPRTIGSYRDTWRLFLGYALEKTGTAPAAIEIAALDAALVSGFLARAHPVRTQARGQLSQQKRVTTGRRMARRGKSLGRRGPELLGQ